MNDSVEDGALTSRSIVEDLMRSMRERVPWDVGSALLRINEVPTGQGWDKTLVKLEAAASELDAGALAGAVASYREHLLVGEKSARFYTVDNKALSEARKKVVEIKPSAGIFQTTYPYTLLDEQLKQCDSSAPALVAIESFQSGIAAVFCAKRFTELREVGDAPTP